MGVKPPKVVGTESDGPIRLLHVKRENAPFLIQVGMRGATGKVPATFGVQSFNGRSGEVTLAGEDVEEALGFSPLKEADLPDVSQFITEADLPDVSQFATKDELPDVDQFVNIGQLNSKVDKVLGWGLSEENFTPEEKDKLNALPANATANYAAVTQAEAEAGTSEVLRSWAAKNVRQAVDAWWVASAAKTKLDGIAAGATANSTDAQLRNRSTHTGTQAMSTISGLETALAGKVATQTGFGLSQENFTTAEKAKLAGLESQFFRGTFTSLAALIAAVPTGVAGNYAHVDEGVGSAVNVYLWDDSDSEWQRQGGEAAPVTASMVKTLYESNADTNNFTDALLAKLNNIAASATANATNAQLRDRSTHTGTQAMSTISGLTLALEAKQDFLVSGTNIKTVNGQSIVGTGNIVVESGTGEGITPETIVASEALLAGDYVNVHLVGGQARVRKAGGTGKYVAQGFVKDVVAQDGVAEVYPLSVVNNALSSLAIGTVYFLSTAVAGSIQAVPPASSGTLRQELGVAVEVSKLLHTNSLALELV